MAPVGACRPALLFPSSAGPVWLLWQSQLSGLGNHASHAIQELGRRTSVHAKHAAVHNSNQTTTTN
eukprot:316580-Amphidinium_carterae.1